MDDGYYDPIMGNMPPNPQYTAALLGVLFVIFVGSLLSLFY